MTNRAVTDADKFLPDFKLDTIKNLLILINDDKIDKLIMPALCRKFIYSLICMKVKGCIYPTATELGLSTHTYTRHNCVWEGVDGRRYNGDVLLVKKTKAQMDLAGVQEGSISLHLKPDESGGDDDDDDDWDQ